MKYQQGMGANCLPNSFAGSLVCLLTLLILCSDARSQSAVLLPGSSRSCEIAAGQTQSFTFALQRDQLIELQLTAQDLNLNLRIETPDSLAVGEVNNRSYGPLLWNFIASQTGEYRLVISSQERNPSKCELTVGKIRAAGRREKSAAGAATEFNRAEVLRFTAGANTSEALQSYRLAAHKWQEQGNLWQATVAWQQIGETYIGHGNYQDALTAFAKALVLSEKTGDRFLPISQLANIAYVKTYQGKLDEASKTLAQCRRRLSDAPAEATVVRKRLEGRLQNNLGEIEYGRGNLKASLKLYGNALGLFTEVGDRRGMALVHLNSGYSYVDAGSINEAATEFAQALKLYRETMDRRGEARGRTAEGGLSSLLGNNYAALTAHREARDIFRLIGDEQGEAVTSNGIGQVFEDLNRKQEAIDDYSLALRLNHRLGNKDFEAVSAYYLGRVFRDLDDFTKALEYYQSSLALSRKDGKLRMEALNLLDIASIYVKQRRLDDARIIYQQVLAFCQQIADLRRQALAHHGLGELFRILGQAAPARSEYQQGLALFQQIKDLQGQGESHYWLAKLAQEQGKLVEALAESQQSMNAIETLLTRMVAQNWRSSYFASVRHHFELHVDILMQLDREQPGGGFAELALAASEQARARSLLEQLAETQSEIRRGVDPLLLAREQQLRQQLSAKAAYEVRSLNGPEQADLLPEVEREIRNLNSEYDFVQAQIRAQSPAYARITQPVTVTLKEIQESLKDDQSTVLVEYMLGDDRSYVWLVTPTKLFSYQLPGRQTLEALSHDVYAALTARQRQPDNLTQHEGQRIGEGDFCRIATQLSELMVGPLMTVAQAQRLLLVMDGGLQYVPFEALPLPGADGSRPRCQPELGTSGYVPLLQKFEVVYAPSFSSLMMRRQLSDTGPRPAPGVAVWADPVFESDDPRMPAAWTKAPARSLPSQSPPLPPERTNDFADPYAPPARLLATEEEAHSIMRFAPGGVSLLLTGFAANRESAVNQNLQNYRILHFATHSLVNNRYPSLTGLLLSTIDENGKTQNGLLQLHDIYGLHLNADLVVLSGCKTGLGEELSGEGLVGLTQGFLYAGSRSVVVSLWDVQDKATTTLMTNFYRAMLKDGVPPAAALRQAKLKVYEAAPSRSPYYWAAFVIEGEFRPAKSSWRTLLESNLVWESLALLGITAWLLHSWSKRFRRRRFNAAEAEDLNG